MILAHALLKIDIREKLPRPLVGSPHRSPRRMPSSRESCPPPKRHRVLQQPASGRNLTLGAHSTGPFWVGFRSFTGTRPDGEVAPIPAIRMAMIVGPSRPRNQ